MFWCPGKFNEILFVLKLGIFYVGIEFSSISKSFDVAPFTLENCQVQKHEKINLFSIKMRKLFFKLSKQDFLFLLSSLVKEKNQKEIIFKQYFMNIQVNNPPTTANETWEITDWFFYIVSQFIWTTNLSSDDWLSTKRHIFVTLLLIRFCDICRYPPVFTIWIERSKSS